MTHTTQSITDTFRNAGMDIPDDDMAMRMAESMAYSGYPSKHLQDVLAKSKPASQNASAPIGAFGG